MSVEKRPAMLPAGQTTNVRHSISIGASPVKRKVRILVFRAPDFAPRLCKNAVFDSAKADCSIPAGTTATQNAHCDRKLPWWAWKKWEQQRSAKLDRLLLLCTPAQRARIQRTRREDNGQLRREIEAL